jgi:phosphatidylserine/phosphatidylglycerophosphate/cardiolipin synthase-like enzyme
VTASDALGPDAATDHGPEQPGTERDTGRADDWFLSAEERGNPRFEDSKLDSWSAGNLVRPLIHGATYFARLHEELSGLQAGDRVWFTDWRGDPDERLLPTGPTIGDLLADLARRGVEVRGLVWRSHGLRVSGAISGHSNAHLGRQINEAGGEVLLDQRVAMFGSHHQKLVVIRHRDDAARDVAFVGGIDLSHSRRDDADHQGDPQALSLDPRYGPRPPWHDAALELHGPVVADLLEVFAERWNDPHPLDRHTPLRMLHQRLARMPRHPQPLPESAPPPPPAGPHSVQLLRTYSERRPPFPFAPAGERSVARGYAKAFARARHLIYVEDQYLWSPDIADGIAVALTRNPDLRVIAVVPRYPSSDGPVSGPPSRIGQLRALGRLRRAAPGRVGVYDIENSSGVPIYIHAKICIVDDTWFTIGSDNFNRRSWTTDSELTCAVLDTTPTAPGTIGAGTHAADLRRELWAEHLGTSRDDPRLDDPRNGFELWRRAARDLDDWHRAGAAGPRPSGQARRHRPQPVTRLQRLWADPVYRLVLDPDHRPRRLRGTSEF